MIEMLKKMIKNEVKDKKKTGKYYKMIKKRENMIKKTKIG